LLVRISRRVWPLVLSALACVTPGLLPAGETAVQHAGEAMAPLEAWREIHEACKQAVRQPGAPERITECEAFLKKHPAHEDMKPLLKALVDAYVETGEFDPARVGSLLEKTAALDDSAYYEPIRLVDDHYLKYGLPLDSGRRLLAMAGERIARERGKLDRIDDPKQRQRQATLYDYYETRALILEGLLQLEHEDPAGALETLRRAGSKARPIPQGLLFFDEKGKQSRRMSTGLMDSLILGLAAAYSRTGKPDEARRQMDELLGFFSKEHLKELQAAVREELGIDPPGGLEVASDPLPASDFTLKDLEGNEVRLSDHRGKVVLLNFWATWCGPCRLEMPILQRFEKTHADKGVVVLAVSTDRFNDRSQIKPFLEENNFDFKVLLEDPEQLAGYDYRGIPALYVVDREGRIASARTGYNPDLKEKLETSILGIINGEPTPGRELLRVETAPPDFGLLWMQPVEGDVNALAIAAPIGEQAGEVAVIGRPGLMRWSASGEHLGNAPLQGWTMGLRAEDLDANGTREWLVTTFNEIKVLDSAGEQYWKYELGTRQPEIVCCPDFDGDGLKEIVLKGHDRVVAVRHVPDQFWRNEDFKDLQAVRADPRGALLAQADDVVHALDARGRPSGWTMQAVEGYSLSGRIDLGEGRWLDLFEGRWDQTPELNHDIDGDGRTDIVLAQWEGVVAYAVDGTPLLRISGDEPEFNTAIGDLDGRPGDEVVLFIKHYGLVVLGRKPAGHEVAHKGS
jgi:thiol-disulfide isomerase/thioredoxin